MKNRFTLLYFAAALTAGIIVACSGEAAEQTGTPDIVAEPGEDTTAREFGFFERKEKSVVDSKLQNGYKLAKKIGKHITYFTQTYRGNFFLIQDRLSENENGVYKKKVLFGIIDGNGKQVVPTQYERVGNPGMIADDFMELKQNGKYGLFNYATGAVFKPEYDVLYPSRIMEYVAIGQKGDKFYKIYPDGTAKPFKDGQPAPNYTRLLKDYRFNLDNDQFGLWTSTDDAAKLSGEDEYPYAMIVTPSYLARLQILPPMMDYLTLSYGDSVALDIVTAKPRSENVSSLLTSFYRYYAESRGTETHERYLTTLDTKNRRKSSVKLLDYSNYHLINTSEAGVKPAVRFVNDSIVEVYNYLFQEDEVTQQETAALPYTYYTNYLYYGIAADGTVKLLGKEGVFSMASAVELKRDHFKGCFARLLTEDEALHAPAYDPEMGNDFPMYVFTDQLSVSDLEYMINEIYARHGYQFKDPKWSAIFNPYKWYKGTRTKVDQLLTPVEKKNIKLIQQVKKELQANPGMIHAEYNYENIAG